MKICNNFEEKAQSSQFMATHCMHTAPENVFNMLCISKSYKNVTSASFYKRNMLYNQCQRDQFLLFPKIGRKICNSFEEKVQSSQLMATHCEHTSQNLLFKCRIFPNDTKMQPQQVSANAKILYNQFQSDLFLLFSKLGEKFGTAQEEWYNVRSLWPHSVSILPKNLPFEFFVFPNDTKMQPQQVSTNAKMLYNQCQCDLF